MTTPSVNAIITTFDLIPTPLLKRNINTYLLLISLPKFQCKINGRLQLCRNKMVKTHNCLVKINNGTESEFTYRTEHYYRGRLADDFTWPTTIKPGHETNVLSYERDNSWAGCSGYVTYKMFDTEITIAFSNPVVVFNKLGVGTGGQNVWDNMESHDYNMFPVYVDSSDGKAIMEFNCKCTGGTTNTCTVDIKAFSSK